MAGTIDIGLLQAISLLLPALLVWVVTFLLLQKVKILGESKSLHAIVAIVLAFLVLISKGVAAVINEMSPWFVLVFVFMVMLLLIYRFMGVSEETLSEYITNDSPIKWFVFFIGIIIIVSALGNVYGQGLLGKGNSSITESSISASEGTATTSYTQNVMGTIFHKKILGFLLVMLVGAATIVLLSREA